MEKLGILVGKFPLLSVLVGVVICCVCMTGFEFVLLFCLFCLI